MSDRHHIDGVIDAAIGALWGVVNDLAAIRPLPREYRVSIFGSARTRPGDPIYLEVKELAQRLAERGCVIVTGGGPGLMQAANEGERLGDPDDRRHTIGVRVDLPFEQGANPFVEQSYLHRTFFTRLHHFVRLSNAFIVVDGGIGTTLESMMIWQLLQVRHLDDVPLIFVGKMWRGLCAWAREHMLDPARPLASAHDLEIPVVVDTVPEALAVIDRHLATFRAKVSSGG
jgi:hypothetical protein